MKLKVKNRKSIKMKDEQNKELVHRENGVMVKPNYMLMSLQNIFVLVLVLIGVVLVVYIMPMPEEYFLDCDRECHELDWPMICRIKLTVEVYKTMSRACGNCSSVGGPNCFLPHCISADGRERGVLVANRMLPAPKIHVCKSDILVVDVVNRAPSHSLSFHWRGQPQKETPFMDGAPMLTQCPVPSFTTFQYKFRASEAGTHMYHAHSGSDAADGLAGALIVRLPPKLEPLKKYYDQDLSEHVLVISEWGLSLGVQNDFEHQTADSILINGLGKGVKNTPHAVFDVVEGVRYRFRIGYSGGVRDCPISISIDQHELKMIALDGREIEPKDVMKVEIGRGERVDVVLVANKKVGKYGIHVKAAKQCQDNLEGFGEINYKSDNTQSKEVKNSEKVMSSDPNFVEISTMNVSEIKGVNLLPGELARDFMDETIFMPFHYFERHKNSKKVEGWGTSDGHRFAYPASPLLTQVEDTNGDEMCPPISGDGGECVHVRKVPLGATVEMILHHQGGESEEIFHLHGYGFYVVGIHKFNTSQSLTTLQTLHKQSKLFPYKNLKNPIVKDTIVIPAYGVVALRFKADNPGYWLMRDEKSAHWTRGLDFVLKVGEDAEFVRPPVEFPKCGSFVGPEYFLI